MSPPGRAFNQPDPVSAAALDYSVEWASTVSNRLDIPSSAVSRSYWLCSPIQNSAEFPKYRENSRAVSAVMDR